MKNIDLVYIIEDDPIASFIIKSIVDRNPEIKKSVTFENAKVALNFLSNAFSGNINLPNLILLDINMPVMDAWHFLESLSNLPNYKPISVYILSSSIDNADIVKSKQYTDVKGFLAKPLSEEKLNELLY